MGKYKEAIAIFEDLIEKNPKNIGYYANAASCFQYGLKDTISAIAMYERGAANATDGIAKYTTLANYYYSVEKPDSMVYYSEKALEINPKFSGELWRLLMHYYNLDDFESSKKYGRRLIATKPKRGFDRYYTKAGGYNMMAMMNYKEAQYDSALVNIKNCIAMDPSMAISYTTLAEIYGMQGKMDLFYENLEIALNKGYSLERLLKDEPYNRFLNRPRMKAIVQKYFKDKDAKVPKDLAEATD